MANIIKIPCGQNQGQNLLPYSDISNIKTYCTPYNYTYSTTSLEQEWGEYTPHSPSWATTNYWMDENFVPDTLDNHWSLVDNGATVHLSGLHRPNLKYGCGTITHNPDHGLEEFTCYIVGKISDTSGVDKALLWLASDRYGPGEAPSYDTYHSIRLFDYSSDYTQIGISYFNGTLSESGSRRITPESNRNYHIFAFKWRYGSCALNVDGTSVSFSIPAYSNVFDSYFPSTSGTAAPSSTWDIKLIAFLNVAESDTVITNNVNILRMIYQ